jgi:uncharacterized membrane protein
MTTDFNFIFLWWLIYFLFGLLSLPLTFSIFRSFWDKGYIFSRTISILTITYVLFISGVFKVAPFTLSSILCLVGLVLIANILYLNKDGNYGIFSSILRQKWKIFLFQEIIFFVILAVWSYVRGFAPDIEGLEKYMDWGFVNSALRSEYFPPVDMWFSGLPINYYYFGQLIVAMITKVSSLDSAITYNLAIASTCAMVFTSTFSLASNIISGLAKHISLKHIIIGGFVSAIILTFGGNLHPLYKTSRNVIVGGLSLQTAVNQYWYPDATRFIGFDPDVQDKTIHEFPLYSFVVADLHGHMNGIPIILLFISILFLFFNTQPRPITVSWKLVVPLGFLLSLAFMTNAWDFAVYGLLFAVSFFLWSRSIVSTFTHGIFVIFFWYLFTLPFNLNFIPMAEGLRLSDTRTPFYQLFVLYGGFWIICLPFAITSLRAVLRRSSLKTSELFTLSLIIVATILVIIPEIGYIKDIYIYEHRRANTMFKLVYQAFIMYSIASGIILIRFRSSVIYKAIFFIVLIAHLSYPYFAIRSYYGLKEYKGLNGFNYLKERYPDNYHAVKWINDNISGQPVVLEAVGDSYTTFNHVSSATGLPTVVGWIVHEWLWRGSYDAPASRQTDVERIYQSSDVGEVQSLIQKYSINHIFVGDKEREKYLNLNENNFIQLGAKVIFTSGLTKIYQF